MDSLRVAVEPRTHPALARCLEAFLVHARDVHGGNLVGWARTQRLEPVLYGVGGAVDRLFPEAFLEECRHAYENVLGRSCLFLGHADRIRAVLTAKGVVSRAWRGAVYGRDLYGDAGLRYCTDLDILVGPADRDRARLALTEAGYRLRERAPPAWFLARHHLHWPMTSPDGRVPIDVHWAIDHPYTTSPRVSADVFLDPGHEAANVLLAALHAEKESRLRTCVDEQDLQDRLLRHGPVWPWLDLALTIETALQNGGEEDLGRLAEAHGAGELVRRARAVATRWFGTAGDGQLLFGGHRAGRWKAADHRWTQRLARGVGCRADVLLDWTDYLRASGAWPERALRVLRVLRLACDAAFCGIHALGKRVFARFRPAGSRSIAGGKR